MIAINSMNKASSSQNFKATSVNNKVLADGGDGCEIAPWRGVNSQKRSDFATIRTCFNSLTAAEETRE
jgi:hypothetical protein